jgi:hypothetical protein
MKITCYQNIAVAQRHLERQGIEREFFEAPDEPSPVRLLRQSPVQVLTSLEGNSARAAIVLHSPSREIGLWVRPDLRRHGFGTEIIMAAVAENNVVAGCGPLYARTSIFSSSSGHAMRKILKRNGFRIITAGRYLDLWVLHR